MSLFLGVLFENGLHTKLSVSQWLVNEMYDSYSTKVMGIDFVSLMLSYYISRLQQCFVCQAVLVNCTKWIHYEFFTRNQHLFSRALSVMYLYESGQSTNCFVIHSDN